MWFICVEFCFAVVEIRLSVGARAPAFVNPEPLFRIGSDHAFDGGGKVRRVRLDIAFVVAGAH